MLGEGRRLQQHARAAFRCLDAALGWRSFLPERSLVGPSGWLWGEAPPTRSRGRRCRGVEQPMGGRGRGLWRSSCCGGGGGVTEQLLIGQSSVTSGEAELEPANQLLLLHVFRFLASL